MKKVLVLLVLGLSISLSAIAQDSSAPIAATDADQRDIEALQRAQKQMKAQYDALNQGNPFSPQFNADAASGDGGALVPISPQNLPPGMQSLIEITRNPHFKSFAQRSLALMQDPEFQRACIEISKNPNMKWLYAGLACGALIYLVLRRKVLAATDRWWIRIILRLGLMIVFFIMQSLISFLVLGQPFVRVLLGIKRVYFG